MASPSTLQPTLQQIDELDALLKHMLTLPAGPAEPPGERRETRDEEPGPAYSSPLAFQSDTSRIPGTLEAQAEAPLPELSKLQARNNAVPLPVYPPTTSPVPSSEGPTNQTSTFHSQSAQVNESTPARFAPLSAPSPAASVPSALWLRVFRRINGRFDQWTEPLGACGRWLVRPAGRKLLGLVGILSLAAAAALLLRDWFDWPR